MDFKAPADRCESRRVIREQREEIEMRHPGREQVHRGNSVAIAIERERICRRLGEKMIAGHLREQRQRPRAGNRKPAR